MNARAPDAPELRIDPPAREWAGLLHARTTDADAARLRAALGLPTDRPVVMSGHQPGIWHAGILAKRTAAALAGEALGAAPAWVIVDQDEADATALRLPVRERGALRAQEFRIGPEPRPGAPAGATPAFTPTTPALENVAPLAHAGVRAMVEALRAHMSARDAVEQMEAATADLLEGLVPPMPVVRATSLGSTDAFRDLVSRMCDDPAGCVRAYNAAAAARPGARIAPLLHDARRDRWELPLWRLRDGLRERVWSDELGDESRTGVFAPRALAMTLLLRRGACDLFLHGTGGWEYDRVTEEWARAWLGVELAPMACVSATLRLPLLDRDAPTPEEAARARWRAHHAGHNPGVVGDAQRDAEKRRLLRAIAEDKSHGRDPGANYRALQGVLDAHRAANMAALAALKKTADEAQEAARDASVANDRTWAFPLHSREALAALRGALARAFSPSSE